MKIEDRRIRKTKKVLQTTLAQLLSEKELQKITVKELTEKADIHRGTFYTHYEDVFDLYYQIESRVVSEIKDMFEQEYPTGFKGLKLFYQTVFAYLLDNQEVARLIFHGHVSTAFASSLNKLFLKSCLTAWSEEYGIDPEKEESESYASFYIWGSTAIIRKWVESNFTISTDELINMLSTIDNTFGHMFQFKNKKY